jgi:hypothetical protein
MRWVFRGLLAGICCGAASGAAAAPLRVYTDQAAWQAAAGPTTLVDFNDVTPGPWPVGTQTWGALALEVGFDNFGEENLGVVPGDDPLSIDGWVLWGFEVIHRPRFVLPPGARAFAARWKPGAEGWKNAQLVIGEAEEVRLAAHLGGSGFLGLIGDAPLQSVLLTAPRLEFRLDDVRYGAVPEPASAWLLVAPALAGLRRRARSDRRR